MAKLTKAGGRRRLSEIEGKMKNLYMAGFVSIKDMEAVQRIVKTRSNALK